MTRQVEEFKLQDITKVTNKCSVQREAIGSAARVAIVCIQTQTSAMLHLRGDTWLEINLHKAHTGMAIHAILLSMSLPLQQQSILF